MATKPAAVLRRPIPAAPAVGTGTVPETPDGARPVSSASSMADSLGTVPVAVDVVKVVKVLKLGRGVVS